MGHQCGPRLPPGDKFYEKVKIENGTIKRAICMYIILIFIVPRTHSWATPASPTTTLAASLADTPEWAGGRAYAATQTNTSAQVGKHRHLPFFGPISPLCTCDKV